MKRLIPMLAAALALALLMCAAALAEEAPASSIELTHRMGNGTNLGNTFEACNNGMAGGNTTDDPTF